MESTTAQVLLTELEIARGSLERAFACLVPVPKALNNEREVLSNPLPRNHAIKVVTENGFVIERTLSANCFDGWEVIGYTGANQNSFIDIRIPGACYRVAAYNQYGLITYSNPVKVL